MANLYGKTMSKNEIRKRAGDISQFADMRLMSFEEGKARGMRSIECRNGSGLEYTILPDRGMDIAWASFEGAPFSYISKSEVCRPDYFVENGDKGFLDNFYGGVLTTSGLYNTGAANEDEGKPYGLHGVINNIPANEVCITKEWVGDEYSMKARGKVKQSRFYGEEFVLTRTIETRLGVNKIEVKDEFENAGFTAQPFMLLYHMNFGYPFLSEDSELVMPAGRIKPRTAEAEKGISTWRELSEPIHGYREQCFYHDFDGDQEGIVRVGLFNPKLGSYGTGIYLTYRKEELPCFCQWKQLGEQEYVMGLIPSNGYAEGRRAAREHGELVMLEPGEKKTVTLEISVEEARQF
ncbi:MAG: aldose 1-epimerase family protein [Clostridium sp.]|nr:aldose 1-epimerase family protein [Clostridium sp.]